MSITLRQLRYFIALAETGTFGAAAEASNVSQPALSVQIRDLEAHLGSTLVERHPRGVRLTRIGHDIAARARRILAETGDLEQAARWQGGLSGRLALGVIPTVAPYLLPALVEALQSAYPGLETRIREARTDDLIEETESGRLDASIVALPATQGRLTEIALFEDRFVLASPGGGAPARAPDRLRPGEIDPDRLLLLDDGHCLADQALEVCGLPARRKVDLGASSLTTLSGLVAGGLGLTLLPEISLPTECAAAPRLAISRFAAPEPYRTIGLILREGDHATGWAEELTRLIRTPARTLVESARATWPPGD